MAFLHREQREGLRTRLNCDLKKNLTCVLTTRAWCFFLHCNHDVTCESVENILTGFHVKVIIQSRDSFHSEGYVLDLNREIHDF